MSEIALYRKYRPQKFKEVVGQDHVVNVLENSLKLERISHAYLFAGSRGTGKTSVARILAREIGTSDNDLYEIDAASNRGIDDIRELREGVNVLPFESKYKVYLIDEVHMLTKEAFNALLKTLEEPPAHVVFILATTEMDKLPETIISRCQVFQFKKPTQKMLRDIVMSLAKKEGYTISNESAELIALLGDGSFRDTEGMLQKVLSSSKEKKISPEEVEAVTGSPKGVLVHEFISSLSDKNLRNTLATIQKASQSGIDMNVFLRLILHKVRAVLLLRFSADVSLLEEEFGEETLAFLKSIADSKTSSISSQAILELLNAGQMIGKSAVPELPLELAAIKLCS